MIRHDLIKIVSENIKILRAEYDYSQQVMANAIGLSKKTLIQVEKGRSLLGWTATCATCAIFKNSKLLGMTLGGDPTALVETLAHKYCYVQSELESKNYLFWDIVEDNGEYTIQKNIISEHYKIAGKNGKRLFSSFDFEKVNATYNEYINKGEIENE